MAPCLWGVLPTNVVSDPPGPLGFLTSGNPRNSSPLAMPGVMDGYDAHGIPIPKRNGIGRLNVMFTGTRKKEPPGRSLFWSRRGFPWRAGAGAISGAMMIDVPPRPEPYPLHDTPASLRYGVSGSLAGRRFLWVQQHFAFHLEPSAQTHNLMSVGGVLQLH